MSLYIAELNKRIAARARPPQALNLRDQFLNWYRSLPEFTRNRPFSMSEFEAALKITGRFISPVLFELGWQRKRMWSTTGHYYRYWQPPGGSHVGAGY
jgi:hypothetical protein